jgi:hypothetical protein
MNNLNTGVVGEGSCFDLRLMASISDPDTDLHQDRVKEDFEIALYMKLTNLLAVCNRL